MEEPIKFKQKDRVIVCPNRDAGAWTVVSCLVSYGVPMYTIENCITKVVTQVYGDLLEREIGWDDEECDLVKSLKNAEEKMENEEELDLVKSLNDAEEKLERVEQEQLTSQALLASLCDFEVVKGSLVPEGGMDSEDFGMPKSLPGFRCWNEEEDNAFVGEEDLSGFIGDQNQVKPLTDGSLGGRQVQLGEEPLGNILSAEPCRTLPGGAGEGVSAYRPGRQGILEKERKRKFGMVTDDCVYGAPLSPGSDGSDSSMDCNDIPAPFHYSKSAKEESTVTDQRNEKPSLKHRLSGVAHIKKVGDKAAQEILGEKDPFYFDGSNVSNVSHRGLRG